MPKKINSLEDLIRSLREGKYTDFGKYPKYWVSSTYEIISFEALKNNFINYAKATREKDGSPFHITYYRVNWEDDDLYCHITDTRIESAYI